MGISVDTFVLTETATASGGTSETKTATKVLTKDYDFIYIKFEKTCSHTRDDGSAVVSQVGKTITLTVSASSGVQYVGSHLAPIPPEDCDPPDDGGTSYVLTYYDCTMTGTATIYCLYRDDNDCVLSSPLVYTRDR
jgi:hypothetical protein